jgi:hypothetical protein
VQAEESLDIFMKHMRAAQDARPKIGRVHIGGEILVCTLTRHGRIETAQVGAFEDVDETMAAALANFDAGV